MSTAYDALDAAINEATKARSRVNKVKTSQVQRVDDVAILKATSQAWFRTHRPEVIAVAPHLELATIDGCFVTVLEATEKKSAKSTYLAALKSAKSALVSARAEALVPAPALVSDTDDLAPDFSPLAGDQQMKDILTGRWHECAKCVHADAHLAAIVMMGGLLEALFVARANKITDKSPLISATNAPKDRVSGKITNYQDWMLDSYIKVGCELKWITESARDIADRIKEYRNFVHPEKQRRYGITFELNDSMMFWQVTKALARQLLMSA